MGAVETVSRPSGRAVIVPPGFDPVPSLHRAVAITIADQAPPDVDAFGYPVGVSGDIPAGLRVDREALAAAGFDGTPGQTHVVASSGGPVRVAVGVGDRETVDAAAIRDAAAAFALATKRQSRLAAIVPTVERVDPATAAQVLVEGILLARYAYDALRSSPRVALVESIAIVVVGRRMHAPPNRRQPERARPCGPTTQRSSEVPDSGWS